MSILFGDVCNLLEALERAQLAKLSKIRTKQVYSETLNVFFNCHKDILKNNSKMTLALLSMLLPDMRKDRVYALRENSLVKIFTKVLDIEHRKTQLENWRESGNGDLGTALKRIVDLTFPGSHQISNLTILDIEGTFNELATLSTFSELIQNQDVQRMPTHERKCCLKIIKPNFNRMTPNEAKWFVRILLKDLRPVEFSEGFVLVRIDQCLPRIYSIKHDIRKACEALYWEDRDPAFRPQIGTPVRIPKCQKGMGCKHTVDVINKSRVYAEIKYDGERMQIHVDLADEHSPIKIFSKSGRNSTQDRKRTLPIIIEALRFTRQNRAFQQKCIIEGELVVYDDKLKAIQPFDVIRYHVTRANRGLGRDKTRRIPKTEHLMIVFFDCILVDDRSLLGETYEERRKTLESLIDIRSGWSQLAARRQFDFKTDYAGKLNSFRKFKAEIITARQEGLVIKKADSPYLPLYGHNHDWVKLKKDYINGFGDTADVAIVGAGFNTKRAKDRKLGSHMWNVFHIGLVTNKDDGAKPDFLVVDVLTYDIAMADLFNLNNINKSNAITYKANSFIMPANYKIRPELTQESPLTVVFKDPMVFEIFGSGFHKPGAIDYSVLRWPRFIKHHFDRVWLDAVDYNEYQALAQEATGLPLPGEIEAWQEALAETDELHNQAKTKTPPKRSTPTTPQKILSACRIKAISSKGLQDAPPKMMDLRSVSKCKQTNLEDTSSTKSLLKPTMTLDIQATLLHGLEIRKQRSKASLFSGSVPNTPSRNRSAEANPFDIADKGPSTAASSLVSSCSEKPSTSGLLNTPSSLRYDSFHQPVKLQKRTLEDSNKENDGLENIQDSLMPLPKHRRTLLGSFALNHSRTKKCSINKNSLFNSDSTIFLASSLEKSRYIYTVLEGHKVKQILQWDDPIQLNISHLSRIVILIEERQRKEMMSMLSKIRDAFREGKLSESVYVFDWRIIEDEDTAKHLLWAFV
ncbi:DNA ligase 4 [Neolecta irregularis DAH-3]|uniref:DNA ligase 4 n=1 Tax=Neolecta irregularis (strain DAH-3) TaxID=1198029 RepID=A0A1U7LN40_NEOID|nr:DNA ligase 4 [Neolecta irregularis DAH-3]|eukprot:OLL24090.1 DNA ligase 4 [Neolecta irregularis DAH-3]